MKQSFAAAVLALAGLVAACTVQSVDHKVVGSSGKVTELKVVFDATLPEKAKIVSVGYVVAPPPSGFTPEARQAATQFQQMLVNGFSARFAGLARPYGVTVSPAGPETLRLGITEVTSYCSASCTTRVSLGGALYDRDGKQMWTFNTRVGQGTIFAKISDEMFDAIARELLDAMKKDGLFGK